MTCHSYNTPLGVNRVKILSDSFSFLSKNKNLFLHPLKNFFPVSSQNSFLNIYSSQVSMKEAFRKIDVLAFHKSHSI